VIPISIEKRFRKEFRSKTFLRESGSLNGGLKQYYNKFLPVPCDRHSPTRRPIFAQGSFQKDNVGQSVPEVSCFDKDKKITGRSTAPTEPTQYDRRYGLEPMSEDQMGNGPPTISLKSIVYI
jgi:hypothetical protein